MRAHFARRLSLIAATWLLFSSGKGDAALVTIAHPEVGVNSIAREDLSRVYHGKLRRWPDGQRVVPVIYQDSGSLATYTQRYFSKSASEYSTYWKRILFTGRGSPPKAISSPEELVEFVSRTRGAIGFVPEEKIGEGVKVLKVQN